MFSKFKKVLVSLALASSLALAPMNVSAVKELNASSSNGPTAVMFQSVATSYTVTVPDSIEFTSAETSKDISIEVKDDLPGKNLKISPTFTANEDISAKITFGGSSVTIIGKASTNISATISDFDDLDYVNSTQIGSIDYTIEAVATE